MEAVSVNLCRALSAFDDLDLHVVTFVPPHSSEADRAIRRVTVHRLKADPGFVLFNSIGAWRRRICSFLGDLSPDVVHAHDTYGLMVADLSMPRVFTIHGFIHGDTLVSGERWARLRALIWKMVETKGWAKHPHIISISPYVRERLTGIAKGTIHDIDNPISEEFFDVKRSEKKGVVFSAAVISPRKNTISLLEAFARLLDGGVDGELRLAGSVREPSYGERLGRRVAELGLGEKVIMLGNLPMGRIREELAQASVFALVSLEENSPLGIEEAMAVGVPVVTSNRCGMPYMVRHGESGYLVDPTDPWDIARRIEQILGDDRLREEMGKRSVQIALERFHPRVVASRTRDVYYEAARR